MVSLSKYTVHDSTKVGLLLQISLNWRSSVIPAEIDQKFTFLKTGENCFY